MVVFTLFCKIHAIHRTESCVEEFGSLSDDIVLRMLDFMGQWSMTLKNRGQ